MLSQGRLKEALSYCPDSGAFTWKQPSKHTPYLKGKEAGSINDRGYRVIRLDGKDYKAARLAWLYMTGSFPRRIEHKNRVRSDVRWDNLRLGSLNTFNRMPHKLSTSGVRGVYFATRRGSPRRYCAYLGSGGPAEKNVLLDKGGSYQREEGLGGLAGNGSLSKEIRLPQVG